MRKYICVCLRNKCRFFVSREENLAKIARRVKDYKVEEQNPPREGKRLLVLDVDYTLFGELQSRILKGVNIFCYVVWRSISKITLLMKVTPHLHFIVKL